MGATSGTNLTPERPRLSTHQKALSINLDPARYGTFAEIGAGQEVARWFFKVGGAAATISKSISAYDMTVSDAIYGKCKRYVSRERLERMLDYEHGLNVERLGASRGDTTAFFAFADTVSALNFKGNNECHGWIGGEVSSLSGRRRQHHHFAHADVGQREPAATGDARHSRR